MLSLNRLSLVALLLAGLLACSTVRCLTEDKFMGEILDESGDDFEGFEYLDDESEIDTPYKPEVIAISNYPPQVENNYIHPPPVYQPPPPAYQPPANYQALPPMPYQKEEIYQAPLKLPPPPVYPKEQSYQAPLPLPPPPAYPKEQVYQAPLPPPPPPVYQKEQVYQAPLPPPPPPAYPKEQVYQAPPPPPPPPAYPKEQVYQAPLPPPPPPAYPKEQVYQAPLPPPPPPVYQKEQIYQAPLPPPPPPVYLKEPIYQLPPLQLLTPLPPQPYYPAPSMNYSIPQLNQYIPPIVGNNYSYLAPPLLNKYSLSELVPLVALSAYRGNHWSLFYYRSTPYRTCMKGSYLSAPSYKDIELAIQFALKQLQTALAINVQYLNSTQPSFAARHQVFSFLSQQNARMDEEGLLIELISQYLADRSCLTKWDKQRYLPQLTKLISVSNLPGTHSCSQLYSRGWQNGALNQQCLLSKYRTIDGFCNNPYHPYWGKSNVCHIRLLSPDYADGISLPRNSYNPRFPLPNPRLISNYIHTDVPLEGPYNLLKMQWGQFINHDITNTALSTYEGLVDCCKNPNIRGCWPIYVPPADRFYGPLNVTCLNFIRSGVCPLCQLGPRQQINKNTAFLDASQVYGNTVEQALKLRVFRGGLLKVSTSRSGESLLPIGQSQEQCSGTCFLAGDSRVNQHPGLTALHTLVHRRHNQHALGLSRVHPNYNDEILFQEARRLVIAEYQLITYGEYLPIVFGPVLSAYYKFLPVRGYTYFEPKADPTTWNEYSSATCRFGHSQIQSVMGLYTKIMGYGQQHLQQQQQTFRLKDWWMRPSFLSDGQMVPLLNGMLSKPSLAVDPWITNDVRNHLYQSHKEISGGDLAATNIWRGRDHGLPGYVHYLEYCFNYKVRGWKDLTLFIPYYTLAQLRRLYKVVENIDLFTGGISERHFPGADIGPTFACVNGIQYYHLKFGDRFFFEHGNQVGSFTPLQLDEIKKGSLARLLCRTAYLPAVPQYAFLQPSQYNPLINCSLTGEINYSLF